MLQKVFDLREEMDPPPMGTKRTEVDTVRGGQVMGSGWDVWGSGSGV